MFLGFLFFPPRVLTTARQEPELVMGAAPGDWWGFLSTPSDCQLLVPEVEGSVQEQRASSHMTEGVRGMGFPRSLSFP